MTVLTLTTHILDTARGTPAAEVALKLLKAGQVIFEGRTDKDGRCPALRELTLGGGHYRFEFAVADYFRALGQTLTDPPFLDIVVLEFGLSERGGHYHVPLLVSPYGYSTYRGS